MPENQQLTKEEIIASIQDHTNTALKENAQPPYDSNSAFVDPETVLAYIFENVHIRPGDETYDSNWGGRFKHQDPEIGEAVAKSLQTILTRHPYEPYQLCALNELMRNPDLLEWEAGHMLLAVGALNSARTSLASGELSQDHLGQTVTCLSKIIHAARDNFPDLIDPAYGALNAGLEEPEQRETIESYAERENVFIASRAESYQPVQSVSGDMPPPPNAFGGPDF